MSYINTNTLEKMEAVDIILANPQISFPSRDWTDDDINPFGYALLHYPLNHPTPILNEKLVEVAPQKINGKWYLQYEVAPLTEEEIEIQNQYLKASFVEETQSRLNLFAQTRNYDNILSLISYASSGNTKFQTEALRGIELRDATWSKLYEILDEVESGIIPMPFTYRQIEKDLPELVW